MIVEHMFNVDYEWECVVIKSDEINAFCCPGGKIVVCTGLLSFIKKAIQEGEMTNEYDALAVVLSHEIAHALAR